MPLVKRKDYPVIDKLPGNAKSIALYAQERGCTIPYIYELYWGNERKNKPAKADFKIVMFQNLNFVIPD